MRVELAGALQGKQIITAANVGAADPDLRHGRTPGLLGHRGAHLRLAIDLDLFEGYAFVLEQVLGSRAIKGSNRWNRR